MVTVEKAGSGVVCTNLPADLFSIFWLIWPNVTLANDGILKMGTRLVTSLRSFRFWLSMIEMVE